MTKLTVLNVPFMFLGLGIVILGLSELFNFLSEQNFYQLSDISKELWTHLIVYLGLIAFVFAGVRFRAMNLEINTTKGLNTTDKILLCLLALAAVLVFVLAIPLESFLVLILGNPILDTLGIFHFIVFFLTSGVIVYMYYLKKDWHTFLSAGIMPLFGFLILIAIQHFWEFLAESLKIIPLSEWMIKGIEQLMMISALVLLNFAMISILSKIKQVFKID